MWSNRNIQVVRKANEQDGSDYVQEAVCTLPVHEYSTDEGARMFCCIDETFKAPSYYREVVQALLVAGEDTEVTFLVNSPGGDYEGLLHIASAIHSSKARTVAHITGRAASCASMLPLLCDEVIVSPYAEMFIHFIEAGIDTDNITRSLDLLKHMQTGCEDNFRLIYKGFLSEDELQHVFHGGTYTFNSSEITRRLRQRQQLE